MMIQDDLKQLVSQSVKLLGEALKELHGDKLYREIENLRKKMKTLRGGEVALVEKTLDTVYKDLGKRETDDLRRIAKAFSLMLELINACEAAYRSHKLGDYQVPDLEKPRSVIYVFTSHPTEARSQKFLQLMTQIEDLLIESLTTSFEAVAPRLKYYLLIAVRLSLANNRRPQVKDELEQVFHTVLDKEILSEQTKLLNRDLIVNFRTWVGGDKDGHPKVGSSTMLESFALSRRKLIEYIEPHLKMFQEELLLIPDSSRIHKELMTVKQCLNDLKKIQKADGKRVAALKKALAVLRKKAEQLKVVSPFIEELENLIWLYPALVLSLEIREDSEMIHNAVGKKTEPIAKMLQTLKDISQGMDPKWYVRGFVISMCQTSEDVYAAVTLTQRHLGGYLIPVVPLFENEQGLANSIDILSGAFKLFDMPSEHKKRWSGRFEVMVGYSDSSKENGVLPARLLVEESMYKLEEFFLKKRLTPVFFHGSGGSTSRGGGTVQEQISWWPQSALDIYKVTIQGEMVQRNFNNPKIMRSQIGKIVEGYSKFKPSKLRHSPQMKAFATKIQNSYRTLVKDPSFQELTSLATPYDYLNLLKIGSRPSKRAKKGAFSLRAIPWILCWTQTRLLLPVWWGIGSAWDELEMSDKHALQKEFKDSPIIQTYVKNLGFTIARIELGVWNFHLEHSKLDASEKKRWKAIMTRELELSLKFFHELSGEKDFTWFRPWLRESIYFRSSMIHPLNIIQKLALERGDNVLLRETVTGIACGMLTTG